MKWIVGRGKGGLRVFSYYILCFQHFPYLISRATLLSNINRNKFIFFMFLYIPFVGKRLGSMLLSGTSGFMKTVPSVYSLIMNTFYQSHSTQVAEETVFRKQTEYAICNMHINCGLRIFSYHFLEYDYKKCLSINEAHRKVFVQS